MSQAHEEVTSRLSVRLAQRVSDLIEDAGMSCAIIVFRADKDPVQMSAITNLKDVGMLELLANLTLIAEAIAASDPEQSERLVHPRSDA